MSWGASCLGLPGLWMIPRARFLTPWRRFDAPVVGSMPIMLPYARFGCTLRTSIPTNDIRVSDPHGWESKEGRTAVLHLLDKLADKPLELLKRQLLLTGEAQDAPVLERFVDADELGVDD